MLAVVKTPLTSIRMKGSIPKRVIRVLAEEYGSDLHVSAEGDDELVDVFQTDWYRKVKKELTPGVYLKVFRENKGMTQTELGKALGGLPRQHVSNMENGSRPISKRVALQLARLFDVSVEKFIQ